MLGEPWTGVGLLNVGGDRAGNDVVAGFPSPRFGLGPRVDKGPDSMGMGLGFDVDELGILCRDEQDCAGEETTNAAEAATQRSKHWWTTRRTHKNEVTDVNRKSKDKTHMATWSRISQFFTRGRRGMKQRKAEPDGAPINTAYTGQHARRRQGLDLNAVSREHQHRSFGIATAHQHVGHGPRPLTYVAAGHGALASMIGTATSADDYGGNGAPGERTRENSEPDARGGPRKQSFGSTMPRTPKGGVIDGRVSNVSASESALQGHGYDGGRPSAGGGVESLGTSTSINVGVGPREWDSDSEDHRYARVWRRSAFVTNATGADGQDTP